MTVGAAAEAVGNYVLRSHDAPRIIAQEDVYRQAAAKLHPDRSGNVIDWNRLQEAKRVLDAHHGK